MNATFYKWYHISVFYNQKQWPKLLSYCFKIFDRENFIPWEGNIILYLNNNRGNNLRLSVKIEKKKSASTLSKINSKLQEFIYENPSDNNSDDPVDQNVFMNFNNNRVYYGLFTNFDAVLPELEIPVRQIQSSLSKLIVKYLYDKDITEDDVTMFNLYLQLSVFYCFNKSYHNMKEVMIENIETILKKLSPEEKRDLQEVYIENNGAIQEVWAEVEGFKEHPDWVKVWKAACFNFIAEVKNSKTSPNSEQFLFLLIRSVNNQLLVSNENALCTFYFISSIINTNNVLVK